MSDTRTVPQILLDSVQGIPDEQQVFIPARCLREAKVDVDKSIPDGRCVATTAGDVRSKLTPKLTPSK